MRRSHGVRIVIGSSTFLIVGGLVVTARAQYVPTALDVPGLRSTMLGEGYLQFQQNPIVAPRYGDEYTGWIDVRHPARSEGLANDTNFGFDISDHQTFVRTTNLRD